MIGVGLAVASAVAIACLFAPVLRALPVPNDDPPPDYRRLTTRRFLFLTAGAALAAGLVVAWRSPSPWLWLPLTVVLIPACAIDAKTTYLPLRLTQAGWAACAAVVAATALGGWDLSVLLRALVGAAVLGGAFWLAWRLGMVGFGDVRLMISVGAVTAAAGWNLLGAGLLAGALVGAGFAAWRWCRGRAGMFPYGPSLLAGPFVALALGLGI